MTLAALAAVGLLIQSPSSFAQSDAWSVEVAVANRSDQEQEAAYGVALRRVLLANSGDKTLLNRDDVRDGLRNAKSYVEEFRYRTPEPGTIISRDAALTETVRTTGQATQLMLVRFDRRAVRELIERDTDDDEESAIDTPFANIESALVWMLIEDEDRQILISDPAAEKVRERMRELAGAAGVSLAFPVGDEEDEEALDVSRQATLQPDQQALETTSPTLSDDDVRLSVLTSQTPTDLARIRQASERYGQPYTLVGYLKRNGPLGWRAQWTRLDNDFPRPESESGTEAERDDAIESDTTVIEDPTIDQTEITSTRLDEALQSGLAWLAPAANSASTVYRYGGADGSDTEMLIAVSSVNSTRGYADLLAFIGDIEGVNGVYPKEVSDDIMVLSVYPKSAIDRITEAVDQQDWLRRTAPVLEPPETNVFGRERARPSPGTRTSALARDIELTLDLLR